jgi:propionate CoA-transferase
VFRLTIGGLELAEVAPGIDIERDILGHMAFRPREMDPRIFRPELLNLRGRLLDLDLSERLAFDAERNICFSILRDYMSVTRGMSRLFGRP